MEEPDKGWLMIRIGLSEWMFLLVPTPLGTKGCKMVLYVYCMCAIL